MSNKTVVTFHGQLYKVKVGDCAMLTGVEGHPKLGNCGWVRTSTVVNMRNEGDTIETLNTIYKRRKN